MQINIGNREINVVYIISLLVIFILVPTLPRGNAYVMDLYITSHRTNS